MRRNLGEETHINGKIVPKGAYVIYPMIDVHMDAEICSYFVCGIFELLNWCVDPDPWSFNPGRSYESKSDLAYVGFGGGKLLII